MTSTPRVALYADDNWDALTPLSRGRTCPRLTLAAKADLTAAADRGPPSTTPSTCYSAETNAGPPRRATRLLATIRRMVADLEIDLVHAERVAISRTHGWAAPSTASPPSTAATGSSTGKPAGADSRHGAYEAEAAQLGGYGLSDYIVIEGNDGNAQRVLLPQLAGDPLSRSNPTHGKSTP